MREKPPAPLQPVVTRRKVLWLLAFAVLAALVARASAAPAPFRLIVTDIATPLVPNSVMELADKLGYFRRAGVDVELVHVQQTPSAVAALRAGQGEMANISVEAALQLAARGQLHLKAVASPDKALPFLIAARDSIATPADLAGHAFGVGRIGSLDYGLSTRVMRHLGVSPDTVSFVSIGQPMVRAQALAAGRIDATTMSVGVWLSLPRKAGLHVLVPPADYFAAAPVVSKVNVVTDAVLAERRDDVVAVVGALVAISRDFAADPRRWADAMESERPDIDPEMLAELATRFAGSWSVNGGLGRKDLAATADWLYGTPDFKDVPRVALADWVDFSVADAVLKAMGTDPSADTPDR